ncbi:hypothetical protein ABT297_19650 [Dactylosporangium sp. NPDC000555]|uniref:hypothetical protein n=1 Tax=Dactylosporangium sp. NPDC000555 TaxID=3154260 RepID=UPI003331FDC6
MRDERRHQLSNRVGRFVGRQSACLVSATVMAGVCFVIFVSTSKVYDNPHDIRGLAGIARYPWFPAEKISTDSDEVIVGYTLSVKDGWHVILREDDREVVYVKADKVKSRAVCSVDKGSGGSLPPLIKLSRVHRAPQC